VFLWCGREDVTGLLGKLPGTLSGGREGSGDHVLKLGACSVRWRSEGEFVRVVEVPDIGSPSFTGEHGGSLVYSFLRVRGIEPEVQRAFTELLATDLGEYDGEEAIERTLSDCLARIGARRERRAREELQRRLEEAEREGDHKAVEHLQEQFLALKRDHGPGPFQAS